VLTVSGLWLSMMVRKPILRSACTVFTPHQSNSTELPMR
jgi:hypothetical protein